MNKLTISKIVLIVAGFVCLLGLSWLLVMSSSSSQKTKPFVPQAATTPSPLPALIPLYDPKADADLVEKTKNHPKLPALAAQAKKGLASMADPVTGVIISNTRFEISFIPTFDLIQVEIKASDFKNAKKEATGYLLGQGLTQQGLCDSPVMFYLGFDISQEVKKSGETFSSLAEGCVE